MSDGHLTPCHPTDSSIPSCTSDAFQYPQSVWACFLPPPQLHLAWNSLLTHSSSSSPLLLHVQSAFIQCTTLSHARLSPPHTPLIHLKLTFQSEIFPMRTFPLQIHASNTTIVTSYPFVSPYGRAAFLINVPSSTFAQRFTIILRPFRHLLYWRQYPSPADTILVRCQHFLDLAPCFDFIRWSGCGSDDIRLFVTLPISPVLKHTAGEACVTRALFGNGTSYSC